MIIHLIRHPQAIKRTRQLQEEHRYLTCRGRKRFRKVAAILNKLDINPDIIFSSPKIRAVQTAEILAEAFRFSGELRVAASLGEGFTVAALLDILASCPSARELAFVGHEPDLGSITGSLLQLADIFTLAKGSTVTLEVTLTKSGVVARLISLVTGSSTVIKSKSKAIERLQGIKEKDKKGESI